MAKFNLRDLYRYGFAAVGMVFMLIGVVSLLNFGIRLSLIPDYPVQAICYETGADFQANQRSPEAPPPPTKTTLRDCTEQELENFSRQRLERRVERVAGGIIILLVGVPLCWYHWRIVRRDEA